MVRAHGSCEPQPTWQQIDRAGGPTARAELLQPVFEQFVEGAETADLKAAKSLLASR
jgi:hypothetical protein